ncbi:MAG: ATP-dependent zinc protease family protein [Shimia sp.]
MPRTRSHPPTRLIDDRGRPVLMIGWMEMVGLPGLGLAGIKAKIDTGARTSAIHAEERAFFERDGAPWVSFATTPTGEARDALRVEAPLLGNRDIKNTSGVPETRPVIRTRIGLGRRTWSIDLSLADRIDMTFPMIVGRAALKDHGIVVHTRRTYLVSQKAPVRGGKDTR